MAKLKQATISSLKGVVVVEDFIRHKNILQNPNESEESILNTLMYLKKKKPCKEIINSTGIGSALKSLENHSNLDIAKKAEDLCDYWALNVIVKEQPTVEVRYDNMTKHIRRTSVNFFIKELGSEEDDEKLADIIEREIFHKSKRLISKSYKKTVHKITFVLRYHKNENLSLKNGHISPTDFVKKYLHLI